MAPALNLSVLVMRSDHVVLGTLDGHLEKEQKCHTEADVNYKNDR